MLRIRRVSWIGRQTKQPLCNHWRPACCKPHKEERVDQAACKPLRKASSVIGVWHPFMKLSFASLLLVFLADKLNPACVAPNSLKCCTWKKFPSEQSAQKEEAFARATVALTRAQQICIIMGSFGFFLPSLPSYPWANATDYPRCRAVVPAGDVFLPPYPLGF